MNREIKFRGKTLYDHYDHYANPEPDIKEGTWVYGDLMTEYPYHKGLTIVENGVYHEVDPETVGQYTCLKDKNGVKIWEGDVFHLGNPNILYVAVWHDAGLIIRKRGNRSSMGFSYWAPYLEIVGNVHDNPELLEVLGDD